MKYPEDKICEFLNVSTNDLARINTKDREDLIKAAKEDDYFKLHHLGYTFIKFFNVAV